MPSSPPSNESGGPRDFATAEEMRQIEGLLSVDLPLPPSLGRSLYSEMKRWEKRTWDHLRERKSLEATLAETSREARYHMLLAERLEEALKAAEAHIEDDGPTTFDRWQEARAKVAADA